MADGHPQDAPNARHLVDEATRLHRKESKKARKAALRRIDDEKRYNEFRYHPERYWRKFWLETELVTLETGIPALPAARWFREQLVQLKFTPDMLTREHYDELMDIKYLLSDQYWKIWEIPSLSRQVLDNISLTDKEGTRRWGHLPPKRKPRRPPSPHPPSQQEIIFQFLSQAKKSGATVWLPYYIANAVRNYEENKMPLAGQSLLR